MILTDKKLEQRYNEIKALQANFYSNQKHPGFLKKIYCYTKTLPRFLRMQLKTFQNIYFEDLKKNSINFKEFIPLLDLSAFHINQFKKNRIDFSLLAEKGIKKIVLMEDRNPFFF